MATLTNDDGDDRAHWVEDDDTLQTEPSFVKKKHHNVSFVHVVLFMTLLLW